MFKAEEERVTVDPKSFKKVLFTCQEGDRVLTSVGIIDGGPHARFGQMVLGNVLWDGKHVPWPIAIHFTVVVHNDGNKPQEMLVQAWHCGVGEDISGLGAPRLSADAETTRLPSPAEVLHTIRIRIRKDGAVDGDLDDNEVLYPHGVHTTDGACLSVLQEALLRILSRDLEKGRKTLEAVLTGRKEDV
jgi:hypothetical protein